MLGVDEVFLFSAVGCDALGETTRNVVRQYGMNDLFVKTVDTDTCVVRATLDPQGNATFLIPNPTSFDRIETTDDDIERIQAMQFDSLYFGTIAQRGATTRASLRRLCERGGFRHACCDVNLRMKFHDRDVLEWSLRNSDTLKLNEEEAAVARQVFGIDDDERRAFCERLRRDFGIRWIGLTGGEQGAWISWPQGFAYCPAVPVKVADTIGAGDSFTAAMIRTLHADVPPIDACKFACRVSGLVASRRGAVPWYTMSGDNFNTTPVIGKTAENRGQTLTSDLKS
jgi:fructokinase